MIKLFSRAFGAAAALAAIMAGPAQTQQALTDLDATPKSLFFAGRCLAPVLLREPTSTKDLREVPPAYALAHLYGQNGKVWHGEDNTVLLIDLDEGASCGINAFDETLPEVEEFMRYWLTREDSPFTKMARETLENGDVRISYDGFCEACGYFVHAQALWLREAEFTLYRVFATLPEQN